MYTPTLGANEKITDYIEFENPLALETTATFKKAKSDLVIRPVCPSFLKVTNFNLSDEAQEYPRDSSIILTFNNPIDEDCKSKLSIKIPGLDETKAAASYFKEAKLNDSQLHLYPNITSEGAEEDYIPVPNGSTKTVTLSLSAADFYYTNKDYTEPVKVGLENDLTFLYTINSSTSEKTKIRFEISDEKAGSLRIDGILNDGKTYAYSVGQSFTLNYALSSVYYFKGWKISRTYTDENGTEQTKTAELCIKKDFEDFYAAGFNLNVSYSDNEDSFGYNSLANTANAVFTVSNYSDGITTISPLFYGPVQVKFSVPSEKSGSLKIDKILNDGKTYEYRVGNSFTVNYALASTFSFKGWKISRDYTDENGENKNQTAEICSKQDLEDFAKAEFNLSVSYPENEESLGYNSLSNAANVVFTVDNYSDGVFTISPLLCDPVQVKFSVSDEKSGSLKIDKILNDGKTYEYRVGNSFTVNYALSEAYSFKGWRISRDYTDADGTKQTQAAEICSKQDLGTFARSDFNLSVSYPENEATLGYSSLTNIANVVFKIENYSDGVFTVSPLFYEPVQVKFSVSDEKSGSLKIDKILNDGKTYEYRVGNSFAVNYALSEAYSFKGWRISRTYKDASGAAQTKTSDICSKSDLENFYKAGSNLSISYPENEKSLGYNSLANAADAVFTVNTYSDSVFTISPLFYEPVQVKFSVSEEDNGSFKIDDVSQDGSTHNYKIGSSFTLKYRPTDDYKFNKWNITRTLGTNPAQEITDLSEIKMEATAPEGSDANGYDISSQTVQLTIQIKEYVAGVISISPNISTIPFTSVKIDGTNGKFSPAKGTYTVKQDFENQLEFEPDGDYEFIRWEIYDELTDKEIDNKKYLTIAKADSAKTTFSLTSLPADSSKKIAIRPIIAERPQTISVSPQRNSAGVLRDTTIQVMFDYDMAESSIYYTQEELDDFLYVQDLPFFDVNKITSLDVDCVLYYETFDGSKKYFGYQKGGERHFKNISIINKSNGANIIDRFNPPMFENASTLSIPVNREHAPNAGMNVMVTIDKEFFYDLKGKDVSMRQAEKWVYLVNGKIDTEEPTLDATKFQLLDSKGTPLVASETAPTAAPANISNMNFFKDGEFMLAAELHDNTAPESTFTIKYKKILDASYNAVTSSLAAKNMNFTTCYGENAVCGTINDSNELEPALFKLEGLSDGVYGIYFEFKDGSGNPTYYPKEHDTDGNQIPPKSLYYFSLDATPPVIDAPSVTSPSDSSTSLALSWDNISVKDYERAYFEWKKFEDSDYESENKTADIAKTYGTTTLTSLEAGTRYSINAHYFDAAGNETIKDISAYTSPDIPKSASLSTAYGTSVTVTAEKPDEGLFSNLAVRYKKSGETNWSEISSFNVGEDGKGSKTISNLEKGFEYDFEICSYDEESEKYSPSYTSESNYLKFKTIPEAPATVTDNSGTYTDSIKVSWTAPSNGACSGYYAYLSTSSDFAAGTTTKSTAQTSSATSYTFEDLTPGKKYFVKVESYYGDIGNASSKVKTSYSYTKAAPVTSPVLAATTKDSLTVNWTKPVSDYVANYYIYYKKAGDSSWSTAGDTNTLSYKIENLSGGEKYNVRIKAYSYNLSDGAENAAEGWQICPNPVTNLNAEKLSDTSLKLTWTKPAGNYDGYKIYYYNENETGYPANPNITIEKASESVDSSGYVTKTITGLSSKKFYNIKVESYIGTGSLKTPETTTCSLKLDGVKSVSADATATNKIKLSWSNPASTAYDGIRIYRGTSTTPLTTITSKTTTSYEDSGLSTNTQYSYKIETYKIDNGEEFSTYSTRSCYTYSSPVTNLSAVSNTPGELTLSWTNPENSNYSDIYIYNGLNYVTRISIKSTNSYKVTGLTGGTSYTYSVRTRNAESIQNTSYPSVTKYTMPSPVTNLTWSEASTNQTSAYLSWTKPSGSYTGLKVYYKLSSASSWTLFKTYADNTTSNCSVTGLTAGKTYNFKVETYSSNVTNSSSYTYPSCTGYTKCNAVTGVSLSSRTTNSLKISWTNPTGDYTGVRLYYKQSSASANSYSYIPITNGSTSYTLSNLTAGTSYDVYLVSYYYSTSYLVTSTSTGSDSSYPLKKATNPNVPTGLSVARNSSAGLTVSWSAPGTGNKTGYRLYYKTSSATSWSYKDTTSTSYSFGNTNLTNSTQYNFYVLSYYTVNSETLYSSATSTKSYYTMPAAISSSYCSVYSDDTMGNIVVRWYNPSSSLGGVNVYLGTSNSYAAYTTNVSSSSYSTCAVKISSYIRSSSYTIRVRPYHNLNGSEMEGPETSFTFTPNGATNLMVNGIRYSKTQMQNVITSSYTINKNTSRTGGAFTKNRIVTLSPYSIGAYEVTRELFKAVMGYDPSSKTDYTSYPVQKVTWYDAIAFCNRLSALQGLTPYYTISGIDESWWGTATIAKGSGKESEINSKDKIYIPTSTVSAWDSAIYETGANGYRLPTEAQWEFAGRGGSTTATEWGYTYSGSNTVGNVGVTNTSSPATVGSKNSNRLGLYDMTGNVWEWLTDWNNNVPDGTFTDPYCGRNTSADSDANPGTMKYTSDGVLLKGAGYKTKDDREIDYNSKKSFPANTADDYGFRICRNVTY